MDNFHLKIYQELQNKLEIQNQDLNYFQSGGIDTGFRGFNKVTDLSYDHQKVSVKDIEDVQNLIELCLQMYMEEKEVVEALSNRATIDPIITKLVWERLENENSEFFSAYYQRLEVKRQILYFNQLLKHQYRAMKLAEPWKLPSESEQNLIHRPTHDNNIQVEYSALQRSPVQPTGQPYLDSVCSRVASRQQVNGGPVQGNFHQTRTAADIGPAVPATSDVTSISQMLPSPALVTSSGHFSLTASEITSGLDAAFAPDNGGGHSEIPWNFGDLGALESDQILPFSPSGLDIVFDYLEQENIGQDFAADLIQTPPFSYSEMNQHPSFQ